MKCPKCGKTIMVVECDNVFSFALCRHCNFKVTDKNKYQDMKDAEMIERDMEIWRQVEFRKHVKID